MGVPDGVLLPGTGSLSCTIQGLRLNHKENAVQFDGPRNHFENQLTDGICFFSAYFLLHDAACGGKS
jgi:hypothetical protein